MVLTSCLLTLAITVTASTLLLAVPAPQDDTIELPAQVKVEESCSRAGGICLPENECPKGQLNPTRGLCPLQQASGIECCHGVSILERRCRKRGGECTLKARCGRKLWDSHAQDCSQEEACCILTD